MFAFEVTEQDVENVLRINAIKVANSGGKSFSHMAEDILPDLDTGRVADAALSGGDTLDEQTDAAYEEIRKILVEDGVLEPLESDLAA